MSTNNEPTTPQQSHKRSVWSIVLKVIISVATAIAGALGIASCSK